MSKSEDKASKKARKAEKALKAEHVADVEKPAKTKSKKEKTPKSEKPAAVSSLGPAKSAFDPAISSLFANSLGPSKPVFAARTPVEKKLPEADDEEEEAEEDDEELSEVEDVDMDDEEEDVPEPVSVPADDLEKKRKRKRKDENEDLEDVYMDRLAREEAKAIAKQKAEKKEERISKRQKTEGSDQADDSDEADDDEGSQGDAGEAASEDEDAGTPPPVHESLLPDVDQDLEKSRRTVFLGNVSSTAITSKSAEKTLRNHLSSFFDKLDAPAKDQPAYKIESVRFRSTAFASAIPKKAAFAKKELMEATTRSTNAYAVYSSQQLAREAARRLNGTIVLDRHLRVDEVAHPAKVDHKRCIFVGNLGFVDDESNIDKANEEEGIGKRNGKKTPSDVEEGLWRTFGTCGTVESVRVVRDSKTRVGKGFAYVQFTDENAVEAAILHNDKRFPPMLPRKLRISRAKAVKRNAKPGAGSTRAPPTQAKGGKGVYNPKMTSEQQSKLGRAGKLFGRAAAAQLRSGDAKAPHASSIRGPESFIFEGHRASSKQGKQGFKFPGANKNKSKGKPTGRSSQRAAAWKAGGGKRD